MKNLLHGEKRKYALAAALILLSAILFYELLEHFAAVRKTVSSCVRVAAPVLYGLSLAYVLNLPMSFIENRLLSGLRAKKPRLTRALSIAICYLLLFGAVAAIIALVAPKAAESVAALLGNLGGYIEAVTEGLEKWSSGLNLSPGMRDMLERVLARALECANEFAVGAVPKLPRMTVNAVTVVYSLIVTLVLSVHALIKKEKLLGFARRTAGAIIPARRSEGFLRYCAYANRVFRRYISGQTLSCLILGGLCYIGMRVLSIPYPELIAVFLSVSAFIPIIGPWVSTLSSALIILVARFDKPVLALWFVLLVLSVQALDDNVIAPRVVGDAVGIPGMLVLIAIIVAGGLFGVVGLLVAVPSAAVIYKLVGDGIKQVTGNR